MADDGKGNNELARLRRRQQPDNKAEVAPTRPPSSGGLADGDGDSAGGPDPMDHLERRVLGAVRQAVTDVMQEGKQPTDLPLIDMDFVATSDALDPAKDARAESTNPMTDNPSTNIQHSQSADSFLSGGASRVLTIIVACASLGFIVFTLMFTLRGNDWDQFGVATVEAPDRPVAGASSLSEVERLSSNEPPANRLSPADESSENQSEIKRATKAAKESAQREEVRRLRRAAERAIVLKAQRAAAEQDNREPKPNGGKSLVIQPAAEAKVQRAVDEKRLETEKVEGQRLAAVRAAATKAEHEAAERNRLLESEEAERQRLAAIRAAAAKAEREAAERRRLLESEEAERQRLAAVRAATAKAEREAAERKRLKAEKAERQRLAAVRAATAKAEREAAERKRLKAEKAERQRLAAVRAAAAKAEREAAERKRLKAEKAERKRLAAVRAAVAKAEREAAERKRLKAEKAERKRLAAIRAATAKAEREAAERKRLKAKKAEHKRLAAVRTAAAAKAELEAAERKRRETENAERQRLEAERQRLTLLSVAVEKARAEASLRKRQLETLDERLRIASLREAQKQAIAERQQEEAAAAEERWLKAQRALQTALTEIGARDPREIEDLATEAKRRLQSEAVLAERLNAILKETEQARLKLDRTPPGQPELPSDWTAEEKVRLRLEQLLTEINKEDRIASFPQLRAGPTLVRKRITLQLKESNLKITGTLTAHDKLKYVIQLPSKELLTLPVEHFNCISSNCPPTATE